MHAIEAMSLENMLMKATKAHCLHSHEASTVRRRRTPRLGTEAGGENRTDCLTFMNGWLFRSGDNVLEPDRCARLEE